MQCASQIGLCPPHDFYPCNPGVSNERLQQNSERCGRFSLPEFYDGLVELDVVYANVAILESDRDDVDGRSLLHAEDGRVPTLEVVDPLLGLEIP